MAQEIRIDMLVEIPDSQSPEQVFQLFREWAEANNWSYSGSVGGAELAGTSGHDARHGAAGA
ncbi:MAG: hypothetical protein EOO16_16760 [Chitinophagaceae bacterium]|nr:MAG: hypothetical protein EOO16_16760 [Chitinophagaceae bacterium]